MGTFPRTPIDVERLKTEVRVNAVLNLQTAQDFTDFDIDWLALERCYQRSEMVVRRVPINDFDTQDLQRKISKAVNVLDELLSTPHRVYLHCTAGISRAPSTAVAYLAWRLGWNLEEALIHVQNCRPCTPNKRVLQALSIDRSA